MERRMSAFPTQTVIFSSRNGHAATAFAYHTANGMKITYRFVLPGKGKAAPGGAAFRLSEILFAGAGILDGPCNI